MFAYVLSGKEKTTSGWYLLYERVFHSLQDAFKFAEEHYFLRNWTKINTDIFLISAGDRRYKIEGKEVEHD